MPDTIPIIYAYARTKVAHWAHMYSNTLGGLKHHKTIDLEKNPILHSVEREWIRNAFKAERSGMHVFGVFGYI